MSFGVPRASSTLLVTNGNDSITARFWLNRECVLQLVILSGVEIPPGESPYFGSDDCLVNLARGPFERSAARDQLNCLSDFQRRDWRISSFALSQTSKRRIVTLAMWHALPPSP